MKAAYVGRYGPPEVIEVRDVPDPVVGEHDVLIRQHASVISPASTAFRAANPFLIRMMLGWTKPRDPIPGGAVAGEVVRVGAGVTKFRVGDRVFGTTDPKPSGLAELVALPEDGALVKLPEGADFGEAAGLTYSFLTAMPFLRDVAAVKPGQAVLINGAAGSVGIAAVQLAKHFGAIVTGVTSTAKLELVRSLGADRVIDRLKEDFTKVVGAYDVIFDAVGKSSFAACKNALKPGGIYLTTAPSIDAMMRARKKNPPEGKRAGFAASGLRDAALKAKDLAVLAELIAAGTIRGVVAKRFPLAQMVEAHRFVERGDKAGDVIVTFG